MARLIISIVLTLLVSTFFSLIFIDNFFKVFLLATLLQVLFFYFFNTVFENYIKKQIFVANNELEKARYKNIKQVMCPCGVNNIQDVELNLDEETVYTCNKCNKDLKTHTTVNTVLVTNPIYTSENGQSNLQ